MWIRDIENACKNNGLQLIFQESCIYRPPNVHLPAPRKIQARDLTKQRCSGGRFPQRETQVPSTEAHGVKVSQGGCAKTCDMFNKHKFKLLRLMRLKEEEWGDK